MPYVYSTLTNDNIYAGYKTIEGANEVRHTVEHTVFINGGHGLINKNFITPQGVVTEVSDADLEFLKGNDAFKFHYEGGFLTYDESKVEPEKVAADLEGRDGSAQLTPADYETGGIMDVAEPTVAGQTKAKKK
jgi:hypothetical protein